VDEVGRGGEVAEGVGGAVRALAWVVGRKEGKGGGKGGRRKTDPGIEKFPEMEIHIEGGGLPE